MWEILHHHSAKIFKDVWKILKFWRNRSRFVHEISKKFTVDGTMSFWSYSTNKFFFKL